MSSAAPVPRPGTVTTARALLYWLALAQAITVGLNIYLLNSVYTQSALEGVYRSAGARGSAATSMANSFFSSYKLSFAWAVILSIIYAILAFNVGKHRQGARVTSWVIVSLFGICCGGAALATNAAGASTFSSLSNMGGLSSTARAAGTADPVAAAENLLTLLPDWISTTQLVVGSISILASIIVVIALALPPSHPYFRQSPEWAR